MNFNDNVVVMMRQKFNLLRHLLYALLVSLLLSPASVWAQSLQGTSGGFVAAGMLPARHVNALQLALNDEPEMSSMMNAGRAQQGTDSWQEPWLTGNKAHKYMGLGSLLLAGLTVLTSPDDDNEGVVTPATASSESTDDSLHQGLANGALALGVGAVVSGLIYHLDDIRWENGITDPDNLHMLLGLLGVTGYAVAVANGGEGGHAAAGIVGGLSMIGAIKLEW